jgi:two-component system, OmpR family, sensor kinase
MASVRSRMTAAYAAALVGTMVVFALVLREARRAAAYRELEQSAMGSARRVVDIIRRAQDAREPLTVLRDTLPVLSPALQARLEGVPEYVLVLDLEDRLLYASFAVRQLSSDDVFHLLSAAIDLRTSERAVPVALTDDALLVAVRRETRFGPGISRVVAGVSTRAATVAPRELVGTMLVVAPIILLLSTGLAFIIAGEALRPVERIINEVEAITDGRSLHRRLPVDDTGDEVARLTATLNAMIGRLETSFGALRRFTADASHELKTPLTVLRADVERAMTVRSGQTEQLVALEEALQETTRMAGLVDSLLTLARADEGRFDLHREPVALEPLVRDVYETTVILGEAAELRVNLTMIEPATVMGDAPRLRQLFLNLVTNAIKYTPQGGEVSLSLVKHDRFVLFSVRDSGIGIAAADLPYVFDRFWRADRVRSRPALRREEGKVVEERGGFGLGLAISQYIAQAHGGTLTATSRLGRGSTFTVTLPIAEAGEGDPDRRPGTG